MSANKLFLVKYLFFVITYNFISNNEGEKVKVDAKKNFLSNFKSFLKIRFEKIPKKYIFEKSFYLGGFLLISFKIDSLAKILSEIKKTNENFQDIQKKDLDSKYADLKNLSGEIFKTQVAIKEGLNKINLNNGTVIEELTESIKSISGAIKGVAESNNAMSKIVNNLLNFNKNNLSNRPMLLQGLYGYGFGANFQPFSNIKPLNN